MEGFDTVSTQLSAFNSAEFFESCSSGPLFVEEHGRVSKRCQKLAQIYVAEFGGRHVAPNNLWLKETHCLNTIFDCRSLLQAGKGVVGGSGGEPGHAVNYTQPCCPVHSGRCSGDNRCKCSIGLDGARCQAPCKLGCVNECSGRGECLAAWCRCQQGWFGIDCSIPGNETIRNNASLGGTSGDPGSGTGKNSGDPVMGNSASNPTVERVTTPLRYWRAGTPVGPTQPPPKSLAELKIYVYDVPAHVLQGEPCPFGCGAYCGDGIYKANIFFLSTLLNDPAHVTYDPNEAHLFLAPLLPYRYSSNLGRVGPHILDTIDVIRPMGYFDRNGGRDHIWWAVGDRATCDVPAEARVGIIIGHYGRLDVPRYHPHVSCVDPRKDVVVPPISPASQPAVLPRAQLRLPGRPEQVMYVQVGGVLQARAAHEGKGLWLPRPTFIFMAASNRPLLMADCGNPDNNALACRDDEYGMGIRAALFDWYGKLDADSRGHVELLDHAIGDYYDRLRSSRFCLEALGHGFSTRIVDYMASGCIPVIFKDDVLWPFESEFAFTFRKQDIPSLMELLRSVSDTRVREMQAAGQRVHKAFLWDQTYGMAYNYTMSALARVRANMNL
eukprot:jgi/Mesvir1/13703/Mv04870-RA.1